MVLSVEILTVCYVYRKMGAVCVSFGYRICRTQSWHLEISLLAMAAFCFIAVWIFGQRKSIYFKSTWLIMGLFFTTLLIVCQFLRMKPRNLHPTSLTDVADALKWSHKHGEIFGADCKQIILMGHSAGAHLITTLYAHPGFWNRTNVPRTSIIAIVGISGVYSAAWMRSDVMCRFIGNALRYPCCAYETLIIRLIMFVYVV